MATISSDVPTEHKKAVKHWTSTPEGKKKLARAMRKAWKTRKRKPGRPKGSKTKTLSASSHAYDETPSIPKKTSRAEVAELALIGARVKLAELDRERAKLMHILGIEEAK